MCLPPRTAFSFLELAIVIVISALIAGAVLTGQNMIRAAELRSVAADAAGYVTTIGNFRNQYGGLPGDIINASRHFTGGVDGNGDGQVLALERFQYWYQLKQAGMVEKHATGTQGPGGIDDFVVGTNVPASRMKLLGFSAYYYNLDVATANVYASNYGNMLTFGQSMGVNAGPPIRASLQVADAYNLDVKSDDGVASSGKWIAQTTGAAAIGPTGCSTLAGAYNVSLEGELCGFFIKTGF